MSQYHSAASLRREVSARNLALAHETTFGTIPSVLHAPQNDGSGHGNFLPASWRRIAADPGWKARLSKAYTGAARVPRRHDRRRAELDCAVSSDALLMNLFCYPGFTSRPRVAALLGVKYGARPRFGVRAHLSMSNAETDRTELDLVLAAPPGAPFGPLLVEAKLTETGFQTASRERLLRYTAVGDIFDIDDLPWSPRGVLGYQLIRGILAAAAHDTPAHDATAPAHARFLLLHDARRADLAEMYFRVLRAVRSFDLRSRMGLLSWQELAAVAPPQVRKFVAEKYGIA